MDRIKKILEDVLMEKIIEFPYSTGILETVSGKKYFLKQGVRNKSYECEANGLKELKKANAFLLPQVISVGEEYLLTEYITSGHPTEEFHVILGKSLAKLHKFHGENYGFYEDNFIGANLQLNIPSKAESNNWPLFYYNKRLLYQYRLAEQKGYVTNKLREGFSQIESIIEDILKEATEPPTLLHGDLWAGNYLCNQEKLPVLIDPAVYYGHREADLAMTKLFGGFSTLFYEAYQKEFPLQTGWEVREKYYRLYHILNHLNLFGRSYLPEAEYLVC